MMNKKKVGGILAAIAILAGLLLIASVLFAIRFDFSKLSTERFERTEHAITEPFDEIEIDTTFFDVRICPTGENEAPVAYLPNSENLSHVLAIKDGKLSVTLRDDRAWYQKLFFDGFSARDTVIELHLPHAHYEKLAVSLKTGDILTSGKLGTADVLSFENVKLKASTGNIAFYARTQNNGKGAVSLHTSTGDIIAAGIQGVPLVATASSGDITLTDCAFVGNVSLEVSSGEIELSELAVTGGVLAIESSSGDIELRGVQAQSLELESDTGDVELSGVIVAGKLCVETDTGEIEITRSDAGSLYVESSSGDVEMELLTGKIFDVETKSGKRRYPASDRGGGECVVRTSSGDVEIAVLAR